MTNASEPSAAEQIHPRSQHPPKAWPPARAAVQRLVQPVERFLQIQAAGGIVLIACAAVAMTWANSPWAASYEALWHTRIALVLGGASVGADLHFLINDVLMALFFFVVGLEIRREMHDGVLSDPKGALLPVLAALGGMIAPALVYLALTLPTGQTQGWGVPVATDIAFALGILALLGRRVPSTLRVLLLALAVIDDIGAVLIIAVFYSAGGDVWAGLGMGLAGAAGVVVLQRVGTRTWWMYAAPAALMWYGCLVAGVHPTVAGVALGLMTPVRPWFGERGFLIAAEEAIEDFRQVVSRPARREEELLEPLNRLAFARREAVAPVTRLEGQLNPVVAYGVMPLFALANAGVSMDSVAISEPAGRSIAFGIVLGLLVGKPLGVVGIALLSARLGLGQLPPGVGVRGLTVLGFVAGIGFTMALFVGGLAFDSDEQLGVAKAAILVGSLGSCLLALGLGYLLLREEPPR